MQDFKLFIHLFFKNKLLVVLFGLFFLFIHLLSLLGFIFYRYGNLGALVLLSQSLWLVPFKFIVFIFLSYEYFYTVKQSNVLEFLKSTQFGVAKLYGYQFGVMLLLNIMVTLTYTLYHVALYFYYGFGHPGFLIHILSHMLLNFFMVQLVALLVGWILALVFKRLTAYTVAMVFIFLGSPIFEAIVFDVFVLSGMNLYPLYDFFSFSVPSLRWASNFHFGFSVLPDRLWMMVIWITMLLGLVIVKLIHKRSARTGLTVISLIVLASSVYFYRQPLSRYVMNDSPAGSLMYDFFHYEGKEIQTEGARFNVLTYELDMVVGHQLDVVATLTVDEDLPEYHFTLYHRYVVTKVTDQTGELMEFVQNGDHFSVLNTVENLEAMVVHYAGYSPRFYSNRQGMVLPGFFPYFPHAGQHLVFDYRLDLFESVMLPQHASFNVRISGVNGVFSNLEEVAPNHFRGYTSSVTLISGFLNSQMVDGMTVVYPFLDHMAFNEDSNAAFVRSFIRDFSGSDAIETILILPNLNLHHMATVLHSDHLTTRGLVALAEMAYASLIHPRKFTLYWLIDMYLNDRRMFDDELAWELSADILDHHRYAVMMQERIESLSADVFLELAFSYIEDETDERSISEFLLDLK